VCFKCQLGNKDDSRSGGGGNSHHKHDNNSPLARPNRFGRGRRTSPASPSHTYDGRIGSDCVDLSAGRENGRASRWPIIGDRSSRLEMISGGRWREWSRTEVAAGRPPHEKRDCDCSPLGRPPPSGQTASESGKRSARPAGRAVPLSPAAFPFARPVRAVAISERNQFLF
jgi:hypothetical protein